MKIVPILQPSAPPTSTASMPHVLLVVDGLAGPMGGGERVALKLARLLPEYGYRVSLLTFEAPTDPKVRADPPCPIYLLPLKSAFGASSLKATFHLRRFLREQEIQIVQTFFESSDLWAGIVTKTMSSARLIWSRRDLGILRQRKHSLAYRLLSRMPDRVFAVSELVRKHCIEVDGINPARVETIYNGLNLDDWRPLASTKANGEGIVITTVGNIRHVKGHDVLIRAAAIVLKRAPGVLFTIAGSVLNKGYFASLQDLISELGLEGHIRFAGGVKNLREHFGASDIFVLPSRSEGFSNAIVEAMVMGLPVVATNVGGNAEAVVDEVTGFIVNSDDPQALAEGILRLLEDPEGARRMGEEGMRVAAERFTLDAMMTRITMAYGEVLAGKDLPPALAKGITPSA